MLGTVKLKHRNSTISPSTRGRDVAKTILMEFTIAPNEIQYMVFRNSKLAGPRRSASRWRNWHRKTTLWEYERCQKNWYISLSKSGRNAPMKSDQTSEKQSQVCTVSAANLEQSDLNLSFFINTKGGLRRLLHPAPHAGSGMKIGGAHFFFLKNVVARSFTADGNLLQPTGSVHRTPSHVTFSRVCTHV